MLGKWLSGILAMAVALGVACAFVVIRGGLTATERREREQAGQVTDLSQQVARLQASLDAVNAPRGPIMVAGAAPPSLPPSVQAGVLPAPSAVVTPPALTPEEMRDDVEARFLSDSQDRSWSRPADERARTMILARLPAGSRLSALECRSSLCRAETTHADHETYRRFFRGLLAAPDAGPEAMWPGPQMITVLREEPTGEVVSVAYLARPGSGPLLPE